MKPTISLNFDPKSGKYDRICMDGDGCVWNLKQTGSSSGNNVWCNNVDSKEQCYTYNKDPTIYIWYNFGSTSFLTVETTVEKAWDNMLNILWNGYDPRIYIGPAIDYYDDGIVATNEDLYVCLKGVCYNNFIEVFDFKNLVLDSDQTAMCFNQGTVR